MARILAVSSQVARGHVGLSAIVLALQALGHEVIALPTIILSNHPGHAHVAGERVSPDLLRRMLDALAANGWLGSVDAVLTGYLPSVEHVSFARDAVDRLRATKQNIVYLCDPVIGDEPKGVYIAADAATAIRDRLVPAADVLKLNRFELEWLTGMRVAGSEDLGSLAQAHGWLQVIATSLPGPDQSIMANALAVDGVFTGEVRVARVHRVPNGTGDLLSALYLGRLLHGDVAPGEAFVQSIEILRSVVEASAGLDELRLSGLLLGAINAVCDRA